MVRFIPLLLRLPGRELATARSVACFLRRELRQRRSFGLRCVAAFRFKNDERGFARDLARCKSNLWVFRSNQQRFCGDFVIVDMSSPSPRRRVVYVVDLKMGAPLKRGGGGAGIQFKNARGAVDELSRRLRLVPNAHCFELLSGDRDVLLGYLCS